jgi:hypothetical protein
LTNYFLAPCSLVLEHKVKEKTCSHTRQPNERYPLPHTQNKNKNKNKNNNKKKKIRNISRAKPQSK